MRKSTLEPLAGSDAAYMPDSTTEQTDMRRISSGEKIPNSIARMNSREGAALEAGPLARRAAAMTSALDDERAGAWQKKTNCRWVNAGTVTSSLDAHCRPSRRQTCHSGSGW